MIRCLFLTHRLPYAPNRGDRIRAYHLMEEMARFADVTLCSLVHDDDEAAQAAKVPYATRVVTVRVPRIANRARAAMSLASGRPLTHVLLDGAVAPTLERLDAPAAFDLVLAYCSSMARFAMSPPLAGTPFVLDMVDVDSAKWDALARRSRGPRGWIYRREARTLRAFEIEATRRARGTICVNDREAETLRALVPGGDISVLENGVDLEAFRPPAPLERDAAVIFCGVLDYEPNEGGVLWFAREVWPRVHARRPDARFRIVGARATPAIRRAAAADPSIDLVGEVTAVPPHLWRAAVSVAPLHTARGLQNKVLEALAAGLPVVVTPVVLDGLPIAVRPGCVTATDPAIFADAVLQLLGEPAAVRSHRLAALRLDELTWRRRLAPLRTLLEKAAGVSAGSATAGRTATAVR
ncbi:MAG: TIGR03087 family PEP-CTERM/XrtA system glycosyltransferase [Acidobacteria bacterium]|nr:TIGR03087 family PEP-CTERM/XrtA system glycosyltransferase [Acidobacteriota bacterium]